MHVCFRTLQNNTTGTKLHKYRAVLCIDRNELAKHWHWTLRGGGQTHDGKLERAGAIKAAEHGMCSRGSAAQPCAQRHQMRHAGRCAVPQCLSKLLVINHLDHVHVIVCQVSMSKCSSKCHCPGQ